MPVDETVSVMPEKQAAAADRTAELIYADAGAGTYAPVWITSGEGAS